MAAITPPDAESATVEKIVETMLRCRLSRFRNIPAQKVTDDPLPSMADEALEIMATLESLGWRPPVQERA